jgi:hypothetical protein
VLPEDDSDPVAYFESYCDKVRAPIARWQAACRPRPTFLLPFDRRCTALAARHAASWAVSTAWAQPSGELVARAGCLQVANTVEWGGHTELAALAGHLQRRIEVFAAGMATQVVGEEYPADKKLQVCGWGVCVLGGGGGLGLGAALQC